MTDYSISSTNWSVGDTITITSSNATGVGMTAWIINFNEDDYDYGLQNLNAKGKLFVSTGSNNPNGTLSVDITDAHSRIYTLTPVTITVDAVQYIGNVYKPISECLELNMVTVDIGTTITVTMNHNIYTKLKYLVNRWTRYKEDMSNKVTSISSSSTHAQYPSAKCVYNELDGKSDTGHTHSQYLTSHQDISGKEDKTNKSSSITTDTGSTSKYPTVKAVEDYAQPKGNYLTSHQSLSGYLHETDVTDYLDATYTNRPLSANQGKVLNERINDLGMSISNISLNNNFSDGITLCTINNGEINTTGEHLEIHLTYIRSYISDEGYILSYNIQPSNLTDAPYYYTTPTGQENMTDEIYTVKHYYGVNPDGFRISINGVEIVNTENIGFHYSTTNNNPSWKVFNIKLYKDGYSKYSEIDKVYEEISNKTSSLSSSSTDIEYPSAKCVYDELYGPYYSPDKWNNTSSNSTVSINNNSVTGTSVCNHLLIEELTDATNYVFEFDVTLSTNNRSCIKIGGDDYDSDDNYYQIVTDVGNTMIQVYDDGSWTTTNTLSSNYLDTGTKHWKFIRKDDYLSVYVNDEEIYTFDNMNDHTNRFGFGKWGGGTITLSNFKLKTPPYIESQPIRAYADLNDYTEIGFYYSPTGTVSSTLSNCPVTNAFSLFVEKSSGYENACTQTLTSYDSTIIKKYTRFIQTINGTLQDSGWVQIPLSSQYIPNGSDLNDYTNVGMYYNGASAETTNITNLPNNDHTAFCLFVETMGGNAKKQTWTKQSDINSIFVRIRKWDNTWTSWKPVWEDTSWQNVTFKSNYGNYSSTETVQYRRVGKVVQIRGVAKNTSQVTLSGVDSTTQVATISDTSCRPSRTVRIVQQGSSMNRFLLYVTNGGVIEISRYGTTSAGNIPAGAWLNMSCTFMVD